MHTLSADSCLRCTPRQHLSRPSGVCLAISPTPWQLSPQRTSPSARKHNCLRVYAWGKRASNQQLVQPQQSSGPPLSNVSICIKVPLALAAAFAVVQLVKRVRSNTGSISQLESRGLIDEDRHGQDPFYSDIMKNVNTVQMEELSTDQIKAARDRRLKERESWTVDIDDIVLPDNHPFAVKKPVSKEDEELVAARLKVTKGLPLQDLSGKRGFPEDGKGQADMEQVGRELSEAGNIVRKPSPRVRQPAQVAAARPMNNGKSGQQQQPREAATSPRS